MKTLLGIITVVLLGAALTCQAVDYDNHFFDQRVYRVSLGSGNAPTAADMALIRLQNGEMVLNTDDDVLYIMHATNVYTKIEADGTMTVAAFEPETLTVSGKSTLNGELEVNGSDVDINMTLTNNTIDVAQTNAGGKEGQALIEITDARTGATASDTNEATLVINSAGTYGLSVNSGIVSVDDEIDCADDLTIDPAGDDLIVDATVDATAYTCDAAAGLDTKTAGELKVGAAMATSVAIGYSGTTVEVVSSDWTINTAGVIANAALSADQLTAGSTASAINGTSITNLTAANIGAISAASAVTNVIIDTSGAGITNTIVLYPFGGVYVVGSWATTP